MLNSVELSQALIRNAAGFVLMFDLGGEIRYVSDTANSFLGYESRRLRGVNLFDLLHGDDRADLDTRLAELTTVPEEAVRLELRVGDAGGEYRWVEVVLQSLLDTPGVDGIVANLREVSETRAMEPLRPSEAGYRSLVGTIPAITYIEDADTNAKLYHSPQVEIMLGYKPEIYQQDPFYWRKAIHSDDRKRVMEQVARARNEGWEAFSIEYRVTARDGSIVWVQDEASAVRDRGGRVRLWHGAVFGITGRRHLVNALQESEKRFRELIDKLQIGVLLQGPEAEIYLSNPRALELLGLTEDQLLGKTSFDPDWNVIHEDGSLFPGETHPVPRAIATGLPVRDVVMGVYRPAFGARVWLLVNAEPQFDGAGNVAEVICTFADVTDRKQAEDELRRRDESFRSLVQNASDLIATLDREGNALYLSPSLEKVQGYKPEERLDANAFVDVHPDDVESAQWLLAELISDPTVHPTIEFRLRHRDGSWRWIEAVGSNLLEDPAIGGLVINARDVTDRKAAEASRRASESELAALVGAMTDLVMVLDENGRCLKIAPTNNPALYRPKEQVSGSTLHEILPEEPASLLLDGVRRALETRQPVVVEYNLPAGDRSSWFSATLSPMGENTLVGVARNITRQKETEERLREAENRYRTLVENIPAVTYIQQPGEPAKTVYVSPQIEEILGYTPEEYLADPHYWIKTIHPDDRERVLAGGRRVNETGGPSNLQYRKISKNGHIVWLKDEAILVRGEGGEPLYWQGIQIDITWQKRVEEALRNSEKRLAYQALHDPLTGLPNRTLLMNRLKSALSGKMGRAGRTAVLFLDLDNFKLVNDSLGHEAGDQLLVAVSRRLEGCVGPRATIARLGGDEFAVLLDDADDVGEAERVAQRILNGLEAPFAIENREINVAASIGIAFRGQDDNEPGDLLRKADLALYQVKYKDKAGYRVFEETMSTSVSERLELEAELRRAIELDEFEVFYQPIIQVSSGQAVAFEALLRWRHPERGLLQPLEFISVAEEVGLMVPVGYQVIRHACTQASLWNKRYPSRRSCVFVNLSARQLAHPRLVEDVSRIVLETGLPAGALCLEATENVLMDDTLATRQTLNKLKELDVELALDDFGTGHSSLAYLKNFPIDTVKIDQSFVGGLGQDPTDKVLISAIIELVHALDMKVVAEGVETGDQLSHLVEIGCDLVQGNYLSEPLPAEGLTPLLASGSWRVT